MTEYQLEQIIKKKLFKTYYLPANYWYRNYNIELCDKESFLGKIYNP